MKCDHLIGRTFNGEVYVLASEAMEAIAELKKKLMPCLNGDCILTCEVVEKYGKENAELKAKLEDAKATAYAESVDAGMSERRLKRAPWLARAERSRTEQCYENYSFYIHRHQKTMYGGTYRPYIAWLEKWIEVECKCKAKAEEYK
jgi:hypothetical protein